MEQTLRIVECVRTLETVGKERREQYVAMFLVAAASGLRCRELLALKGDDIDFANSTVRVDPPCQHSLDRFSTLN
jgi:integrase